MSLKDRSRGYEFAEFEREFLFYRKDTGFVEYVSREHRLFSLKPSPCFDADKHLHYIATESCDLPQEGDCIEVKVTETDEQFMSSGKGIYKHTLKKIGGWKSFDYQRFLKRKKLIDYDQIINFFTQTFRGDEDIKKRIATCAALFAFSSPPVSDFTGGVNAAILSKKPQWTALKKPMKIIPADFFRTGSKYFYCLADKEKIIPRLQSEEVNLAFLRPEKMMADIPIVLDDVSVKGVTGILKQDIEDNIPLVTAYLIDSLMLKPNPLTSVEKEVTDAVYEITQEYKRSGISPYRQNLGDAIPTLSASITRLHLETETNKKRVREVLELWKEMHQKVKYRMGDSLPISKFYDLSDNTRILYSELNDTFGKEYWIPMQEVLTTTTLTTDTDFIHALNELVEQGLSIRDRRGVMILEKVG